ncbi:OmpH family outer membrane protein [Guyparkeria hydrothermalis]|uniref:OmpH family outer membrane protein n=1 Tax=Guyparkeria hydrothermalis TaxID=923 RepID=UPI00202075B9|nr:OmpH family outer membrane protein [Guyparkeria hydrothermalis]
MIRFVQRLAFLTVALCVPLLAQAADDVKIGFVNSSVLLEQAPQAAQAKQKLEQEFSAREEELRQLRQEIQGLEGQLNREGVTMTDSDRGGLERELNRKLRDLQRQQSNFRDDLNLRKNEELGKLQRLVLEAIREVARDKGYDLVLSEGVVYSADRVELTEEVLDRLEQKGR